MKSPHKANHRNHAPRRLVKSAAFVALALAPSLAAQCASDLALFGGNPERAAIVLRLVNESGVPASVESTFYAGDQTIRETKRTLDDDGPAADDLIAPTSTDLIRIVAHEADPDDTAGRPFKLGAADRIGDVLIETTFAVGADVLPGQIINFTIPALQFQDCNANGIHDPTEINEDASVADCNSDGTPDECQSQLSSTILIAHNGEIFATDASGAPHDTLIDLSGNGLGSAKKIAADWVDGRLFCSQSVSVSDGTVELAPLSGGTSASLVTSQLEIEAVAWDPVNQRVYWATASGSPGFSIIHRMNADGSNSEDLITGIAGIVPAIAISLSPYRLYFAAVDTSGISTIIRTDIDGVGAATVLGSRSHIRDIEIWSETSRIFWTEKHANGGVYSANLDGSGILRLVPASAAEGLAIDRANCKIYWVNDLTGGTSIGTLDRAHSDGTNPETILDTLSNPQDVTINPPA